jgi:hypothetical protein
MLKWSLGEPQEKSLRGSGGGAGGCAGGSSCAVASKPPFQPPPEEDNVCLLTNTKEKCAELVRAKDKEELYHKINSREPIAQMGLNPFHTTQYIDDIMNQEKYLRTR